MQGQTSLFTQLLKAQGIMHRYLNSKNKHKQSLIHLGSFTKLFLKKTRYYKYGMIATDILNRISHAFVTFEQCGTLILDHPATK